MGGFDLTAFQLLFALALERSDLTFGEDQAFFSRLFLKRGKAALEGLELMPQPYGAHAGWADEHALLSQLIGYLNLASSWVIHGERQDPAALGKTRPALLGRTGPVE